MPVITSHIDRDQLALEFVAEFDASLERVWALWQDPRQLERWWGPPEWPATFTKHDSIVGGESRYHMTGPGGETSAAWFRMTKIEPPTLIEFDDGFIGDDGEPDLAMPVIRGTTTLEALSPTRTRMRMRAMFASAVELEQVLEMGMVEGMTGAMGQIDALLAEQ